MLYRKYYATIGTQKMGYKFELRTGTQGTYFIPEHIYSFDPDKIINKGLIKLIFSRWDEGEQLWHITEEFSGTNVSPDFETLDEAKKFLTPNKIISIFDTMLLNKKRLLSIKRQMREYDSQNENILKNYRKDLT